MEPNILIYALNKFKLSYRKILLDYTHSKLKKLLIITKINVFSIIKFQELVAR